MSRFLLIVLLVVAGGCDAGWTETNEEKGNATTAHEAPDAGQSSPELTE